MQIYSIFFPEGHYFLDIQYINKCVQAIKHFLQSCQWGIQLVIYMYNTYNTQEYGIFLYDNIKEYIMLRFTYRQVKMNIIHNKIYVYIFYIFYRMGKKLFSSTIISSFYYVYLHSDTMLYYYYTSMNSCLLVYCDSLYVLKKGTTSWTFSISIL